jgi:hypothetical protein
MGRLMVEISRKKEVDGLSSVNIGKALETQLEIERMKTLRSLREGKTRRAPTVAKSDFGNAVNVLERELKDRERLELVANKFGKRNPVTEILDTPFGKGLGEAAGGLITELMRGYMAGKEQQTKEAKIKALSGKEGEMPRPVQLPVQPQATLSLGEEDKRIIEEQKRGQDAIINKLDVVTNTFSDAMKGVERVMNRMDSLEQKITEMEVKPEELPKEIEEVPKEEVKVEKEPEIEEPILEIAKGIAVGAGVDELLKKAKEEEPEEYYSRNYLMKLKLNELKELGIDEFGLTDQDYEGKKKKQIAFLIGRKQKLKQSEEN